MKLRYYLGGFALTALLFTGCGDTENFVATNPGSTPSNGFITFNHILARSVPSNITTYRVSGMNDAGALLFGPQEFAKTADLTIEVPATVTVVSIVYLDAAGVEQGAYMQGVLVVPGETTNIVDPESVYATGNPVPPATTNAFHNDPCPLDVNADGFITPLDALSVINDLNANGARQLAAPSGPPFPPPFLDTNDDGSVSPLDALLVINALNNQGPFDCSPAVVGTELSVQNQPRDIFIGETLDAIEVRVVNDSSQVATQSFIGVTVTLGNNLAGATLGGTTTKFATKGVVVFDDLTVDQEGEYRLEFTAQGLQTGQSDSFLVINDLILD